MGWASRGGKRFTRAKVDMMRTHMKKKWLDVVHSQGLGTREECKEIIAQGRVRLRNAVEVECDKNVWIRPGTLYKVDMCAYRWFWRLYVAYNKPLGVVSATESRLSAKYNGDFPSIWFRRPKHKQFHAIFPLPAGVCGLVLYSDDKHLHSHADVAQSRDGWQPLHTFHLKLSTDSPPIAEETIAHLKNGCQIKTRKIRVSPKRRLSERASADGEENDSDTDDEGDLEKKKEKENPVLSELEKELRMQLEMFNKANADSLPIGEDSADLSSADAFNSTGLRPANDTHSAEQSDESLGQMETDASRQLTSPRSGQWKTSVQYILSCEKLNSDDALLWKIETLFPRTLNTLLRSAGLKLESLKRTAIGELTLDESFAESGEWRTLSGAEISTLSQYSVRKVTDIRPEEIEHSKDCPFLKYTKEARTNELLAP